MDSVLHRASAWAVLVTFSVAVGLGSLTAGHAEPDDDTACVGPAFGEGHPQVQFEAVKDSQPQSHCVFCHWQRVVGGAHPGVPGHGALSLVLLDRVLPPGAPGVRLSSLDAHSSRGPPVENA